MHVELAGLVQVSADTQNGTGVHAVQAVGTPTDLQYPASHAEQLEVLALVQVIAELQWATAVQGLHESVAVSK